jgi:Phage integrase, N-terminal SAM-like domain
MQTLEQTALPLRPRLLDPVRDTLRCKYYSLRTGQSYIHWIKRFIYLHAKRHPAELGATHVIAFLNHLAIAAPRLSRAQRPRSSLDFVHRRFI